MRLALALGRRGQGRCWPNPAVGCVIVREGRIVGRGWTAPGGRPHAETVALAQAGAAARGATAYVSLEPCAHHGATPPCATALIEAGVARVVAPLEDSDPRVSGRGFAMLRMAGVQVVTGLLAEQAALDHAGFFLRTRAARPWVTLKLAMSFDGRIATARGMSRWITGPQARRVVHGARARHDAVMIGAGTARADDPMLSVRDLGIAHQPSRSAAHGQACDKRPRDPALALPRGGGCRRGVGGGMDGTGRAAPALRALGSAARPRIGCRGAGGGRADPGLLRRRGGAGGVISGGGAGGRASGLFCRAGDWRRGPAGDRSDGAFIAFRGGAVRARRDPCGRRRRDASLAAPDGRGRRRVLRRGPKPGRAAPSGIQSDLCELAKGRSCAWACAARRGRRGGVAARTRRPSQRAVP